MIEVIPAIIPENLEQLETEIKKVSHFAKLVQIDISDGQFTQTKTWPYNGRDKDFFEKLKSQEVGWPEWDNVDIEVHLMVKSPENIIEAWIQSGISSVVFHIEATEVPDQIINICRQHEVAVGAAIKPSTPISLVEPIAEALDFIQVMGSDNLGSHGITLRHESVKMIKEIHAKYPNKKIAIDIGVDEESRDLLVEAGATRLVSGGAILKASNPQRAYEILEGN